MSSLEPTLKYINRNLKKVFEDENRNEAELKDLKDIHEGIIEKNSIMETDYNLADDILGLVQNKYSKMLIEYFNGHLLVDEFCNRNFDLKLNKI